MTNLPLENFTYTTKKHERSLIAKLFPSLHFYTRFVTIILRSSMKARRGEYGDKQWGDSSQAVLHYLEDIGVHIRISGLEHLEKTTGPCVIIGNHMSFIETLILPAIILPRRVTFVVKQSLVEYPVFKHIMLSRNPIAVSRTNPRQDLKVVLEEGVKRLEDGMSVVVFPQSTRSHVFDASKMSSIGVKLAKRAGVPLVPLALRTDTLKNGPLIKDFGRIDCNRPIRLAFDTPAEVEGRGNEEVQLINSFIERKLQEWETETVPW
ncbi:lysophospholipid acyltransferase family protein [Desulfosediminicola flagellatus]|uniref:lysophospholipid acyltransferase family protein n=1 Tax=Desulfosediminicola flagellatus TaxID=2569541 RepID=UPI0010AD74EB|nr:lysophospholipid acyltransferase family protein [Desulfosediminicola flagellatus]